VLNLMLMMDKYDTVVLVRIRCSTLCNKPGQVARGEVIETQVK